MNPFNLPSPNDDEEAQIRMLDLWTKFSTAKSKSGSPMPPPPAPKPSKPAPRYKAIAEAIMRELVGNGLEDLILIKNDEVREWWGDIVAEENRVRTANEKAEAERIKKLEDIKSLKELMSRLTPEEKRLLKIERE